MAFEANSFCANALTKSGTGTTYTLGAALTGRQGIAAGFANGADGFFAIYNDDNFEVITGTVNTGTGVVIRSAVLSSSNAGSAVNWTGTQTIGDCLPGERAVVGLTGPLQLTATGEALAVAASAAAGRAALGISSGASLNFARAQVTTTSSYNATFFWDIAGLSVTITPTSSSKVICVSGMINLNMSASGVGGMQLVRVVGGVETLIGVGDAAGSRIRATLQSPTMNQGPQTFLCHDVPGVTDAVIYKVRGVITNGTQYLNKTPADTDGNFNFRCGSAMVAMEIG